MSIYSFTRIQFFRVRIAPIIHVYVSASSSSDGILREMSSNEGHHTPVCGEEPCATALIQFRDMRRFGPQKLYLVTMRRDIKFIHMQ